MTEKERRVMNVLALSHAVRTDGAETYNEAISFALAYGRSWRATIEELRGILDAPLGESLALEDKS